MKLGTAQRKISDNNLCVLRKRSVLVSVSPRSEICAIPLTI